MAAHLSAMAARLFRRQQESPLTTALKRATESGVIDVPKELLDTIVEASTSEGDRKEIMAHLRECLKEPSGRKWRQVHAALVVAEDLLGQGRGSPELIGEVACGLHFDLVQRLAFLEAYQHTETHARGMVRSKAKALRATLVPRIQQAFDHVDAPPQPELKKQDSASTCSTSGTRSVDGSVASTDTGGGGSAACPDDASQHGACAPPDPKQAGGARVLYSLGNIVALGHSDDTTDESSGDEEQRRRRAQRKKASEDKRAQRQRASDQRKEVGCLPVPTAAQQMDLLDF